MRYSKILCGLLLSASLFLLGSPRADAQRQTPGRPSLDMYGSFGSTGFIPAGGGLVWCNYDFGGRTAIGIDVYRAPHSFTEAPIYSGKEMVAPEIHHEFMSTDVTATVGYLLRVAAPRSRAVILSAGGHLLLGVKYAPEMGGFVKDSMRNYAQAGFLIGIAPEVQLEVFVSRNVSLYGSARPRVRVYSALGGHDDWFRMSGAAGLKIYL